MPNQLNHGGMYGGSRNRLNIGRAHESHGGPPTQATAQQGPAHTGHGPAVLTPNSWSCLHATHTTCSTVFSIVIYTQTAVSVVVTDCFKRFLSTYLVFIVQSWPQQQKTLPQNVYIVIDSVSGGLRYLQLCTYNANPHALSLDYEAVYLWPLPV